MAKGKFRYDDGGEVNYGEDERPAATDMAAATELVSENPKTFKDAFADARRAGDKTFIFNGKKYTTNVAGDKRPAKRAESPEPVGRPRGESGPVSVTRQMADRAAAGAQNARAASERRAAAAREAESERSRESRGSTASNAAQKRKVISTAGLNPKTLLPVQGYAKGGVTRGDGCVTKGHTKGKMR